jgi:DNA-binding transcriptional ArsR family regulator
MDDGKRIRQEAFPEIFQTHSLTYSNIPIYFNEPEPTVAGNHPMIKKTSKLDIASLTQAAECLKALAHPHRLQIVQLLLAGDRISVNELAEHCKLPQPTMSEHLRLMQRCQFLSSERVGRTVYYRITEPHLLDIMKCIQSRFGR